MMKWLILSFLFLFSCGGDSGGGSSSRQEEEASFDIETLIDRDDVIWGLDFLADGRIIFSERSGKIAVFDPATKEVTEISGVPPVIARGEGGLLDLRVRNNEVFVCYADPRGGNSSATSLGKGTLIGNSLTNFTRIFTGNGVQSTLIHFGCRIEFNGTTVYLSTGERNQRTSAQDPHSNLGKILAMNLDGSNVRNMSLGHRNVQGLAFRPGSGQLWATEHGPQGGDEINLIVTGGNYGWPVISKGTDSAGLIEADSRSGFRDPIAFWTPAIAPSGLAFWNGDAFIACLRGEQVRRLVFNGNAVSRQEILFENLGWRFRNVRAGPDGELYFSTDEGRLGRIKKAN